VADKIPFWAEPPMVPLPNIWEPQGVARMVGWGKMNGAHKMADIQPQSGK